MYSHKQAGFCLLFLCSAAIGAPLYGQSADSLAMIEKMQNLQFDQLGNPQIQSNFIPPVLSSAEHPHRMLIIPVQYANRGFDRFAGEPNADTRNQEYLQNLLFSENLQSPRADTLTHYYYHQSKGKYLVTGTVFPLLTMDNPSEYYGEPIQNSDGSWRNDNRSEELVEHALLAAVALAPDFPWHEYDVWDPMDYDGDRNHAEADGYIDHFVLVFAGNGQASCQGLFNLQLKFTPDAPADVYSQLQPQEQECAQRIWPHRSYVSKNNGKGPMVEGFMNRRGGIELLDGLWVYDYNMQEEYTEVSTFIHEFGHSLGLPDIYASNTNNSTASWEAMSSTTSPVPQELSAWSRMMLGWMEPCIITPRSAGGGKVQSVYLRTMNDWSEGADSANIASSCESAMVILPPKIRELRMGPLAADNGTQAAYTGQGNDLNHFLSRTFDLRGTNSSDLELEFDAWFTIEADWDYLYIEASTDGENYIRLMPTDKDSPSDTSSIMPSQRGHDGMGTFPGLTGRSGDLDGDGRVESAPGCDVNQARGLAEDQIGSTETNPCDASQWVHASFDLGNYAGQQVEIRFHYFADLAAVEDGALIDNVAIKSLGFHDDFEQSEFDGWLVEGFTLSGGSHDLAVPHYYLLEYRDPHEQFLNAQNYDNNIAKPGLNFFRDPDSGEMQAVDFRYRSGVLLWYYNGSYLWSQNDPAEFGPGNGFLLLVDSTPQEFELPPVPNNYYMNNNGWRFYQLNDDAQATLRQGFLDVMCFQRRSDYYPLDLSDADRDTCGNTASPPGEELRFEGRQLIYGYTLINEVLPGAAREPYKSMGTLYDFRLGPDGIIYRLYDRMLRNEHSADAPFALNAFPNGMQFYTVEDGEILPGSGRDFPAVNSFSDRDPSIYLNPHLPFGSANITSAGLNFTLAEPGSSAPEDAKVKVYFSWDR